MKQFILLTFLSIFFIDIAAQNTSYVTISGAGNQDGTSWANAYPANSIQSAIDDMATAGGGQVWIASGTYYPTVPFDNDYTDVRKKSLNLKTDVEVYGGFSGNETSPGQRTDYGEGGLNETIISGDLGSAGINADNSYYVVYVESGVNNARLDGLTVQDGNANAGSYNDGGGVYTSYGDLTIYNCVIKNNHANDNGGGLYIQSNCVVDSSIIHSNTSGAEGGGIYTLYWSFYTDPVPLIKNSLIYNNVSSSDGGGVYIKTGGDIRNCRIINNDASRGGGIFASYGGLMTNNLIANNESNFYGGGVFLDYGGTLANSTIVSNEANYSSGVNRNRGSAIIQNCIIWNNDILSYGSGTAFEYCAIEGGFSGSSAGSGIINLDASNSGSGNANYPEFISPVSFQGYNPSMTSTFLAADWRVSCHSAIIDTASAALVPAGIITDLAGNSRIIDGNNDGNAKPDLGAYEYTSNYSTSASICQGDTFHFGNMNLTTSGTYQNSLISSRGCDSVVMLTLTVLPADSGFVNAEICEGSSFAYGGQSYNQTGVYYQTINNPNGCDSIIKITVDAHPIDTTILANMAVYENQDYDFYGQIVSSSGIYYHNLQNIYGCDSVIQQSFTWYPVDTILNDFFCQGGTYTFEGTILSAPGTYFTTIQNSNNQDSSIQLNLSLFPVDTTVLQSIYLDGSATYNFYGTTLNSPGTYYHTTTSVNGCDSVLELTVFPRRYVKQYGSGSQNGHNWANAYSATSLQTAINEVANFGGGQVWVAQGTYKPTTGSNRGASFYISPGVELYGGFNGNETSISQRSGYGQYQGSETILSGDINTLMDSTDNTYLIVHQTSNGYCLIDGFTIRDASHPGTTPEGAGVYLRENGVLRNCVVYNNHSAWRGGGVYSDHGIIDNCIIKENKADTDGGGIYLFGGKVLNSVIDGNIVSGNGGAGIHAAQDFVVIDSTTFQNNKIEGYGWGAGLSIDGSADTMRVTNCTFINNQTVLGSAIYMSGNATGNIIRNCTFENNTAIDYLAQATNTTYDGTGGAVLITSGKISNSTFINNTATEGGAVYLNATAEMDSCYFHGNTAAGEGGAVYIYQGGLVNNSTLTDNQSSDGGAVYIDNGGKVFNSLIDSNYTSNNGGGVYVMTTGEIENCRFIGNYGDDGGAVYLLGNASLKSSVFHSNIAHYHGGAIYNNNNDAAIFNCEVFNNYARYNGGGIYQDISNNNNGLVINANIYNNEARYDGGGVYFYFGGELINCNINNNKALDQGGGVFIDYKAKIKNSVLWGNDSLQIYLVGTSSFTEFDTTAILNGYTGFGAGTLIIDLDSANYSSGSGNYINYVNPTSFAGNFTSTTDSLELFSADWSLNCGSAAIDKGDNLILPDSVTLDLAGNARFSDGNSDNSANVDLGPLEADFSFTQDIQLCQGDTFILGPQQITQAGTYTQTMTSTNGCDSILTVNVSILPIDSVQVTQSICEGNSLLFNGQPLTTAGIYTETFTSVWGCDSVVELTLNVLPSYSSTISPTICEGNSFSHNGSVYSMPGIYRDTLTSANGCDSIVIIELHVNPVDTSWTYGNICEGSSYNFHGQGLTGSGNYFHQTVSTAGCDSTLAVQLTVNPVDTSLIIASICEGNSYSFHGNSLTQPGVYYHTLTANSGCDSIIMLDLFVQTVDTTILNQSICEGSTYSFHGTPISQAGTYYHTVSSQAGCDSVLELNLSIFPIDSIILSHSVCAGNTYDFHGQTLSSSGTYYHIFSNQNGCDSVIVLTLNVNPQDTTYETASICEGGSYNFHETMLSQSGTYYYSTSNQFGCDSTVVLYLSVNPVDTTLLSDSICQGNSYNFHGTPLGNSGTYYHTLSASTGCDSVLKLNLYVETADTVSSFAGICEGQTYNFYGTPLTQSGVYYHTITTTANCDSIVELQLFVQPEDTTWISQSVCEGNSYNFHGNLLTQSGIYHHTLSSQYGCDSVIQLDFTVNAVDTNWTKQTICEGSTYNFYGIQLSASGTYYHSLSSQYGCDSTISLQLEINPVDTTLLINSICEGDSYNFHGQTLTAAGIYYHQTNASTGCDSILQLQLNVNPVDTTFDNASICEGQTYSFYGNPLTVTGIYYHSLSSQTGCDSVISLSLSVLPAPSTPVVTYNHDTLFSDASGGNQWYYDYTAINGSTDQYHVADQNGEYFVIVTAANGCLSDTSNVVNVTWISIEDITAEKRLAVYPNPTTDILNIRTDFDEETKYRILSMKGQLLMSGSFSKNTELNIRHLERAVYILELTAGNNSRRIKVIRQ